MSRPRFALERVIRSMGCPVVFTREGAATRANGRVTPGARTSFTLKAVIQPNEPRERFGHERGRGVTGEKMIHALGVLDGDDVIGARTGDRFVDGGQDYEVTEIRDFCEVSGFTAAIAERCSDV